MSLYSFHPSDPDVTDDHSKGYRKGHRWINRRKNREFILIDATTNSAVWEADAQHHVMSKMSFTGVAEWRNVGVYWGVSGGDFFLKRGGEGYINGERVIWSRGQDVALTANACNFVRIDADGVIDVAISWAAADFRNYINLFEVWYVSDSEYIVCKEDHLVKFPADTSVHLHEMLGTVFIEPTGAQMTRVSAGTGAAPSDREIKIVNADILEDHGLETEVPDSGGAGVTWEWLYTDAGGDWRRDVQQTEAVMKWNDGGTPTALGNGKYGVWRFGVTKDNKNSADPVYLAAMGDAEYNNLNAARNAIAAGVPDFTNEIDLLELAQLGYCIVQNSGGGYIVEIIIEKDIIAGNTTAAGATNVAALVSTSVADFDGVLSGTDLTVQSALDTIDNHAAAHEDGGADALTGANIEAIVRGALAAATADVDVNTQKITGVVDPVANQDAATKKYVDDEVAGGVGAHAATHENDGGDEISVASLSGELADAQPPKAHASDHTDGTDDIQNATDAQKGLATAAQITKLDAIEAGADVTDETNVRAALAAATGDIAVNTQKITGVVDPAANQDAATKKYVDDEVVGAGGDPLTTLGDLLAYGQTGGFGHGDIDSFDGDLLGVWHLDEESGTRADAFGARTLDDINTVTFDTGKDGNAAKFTAATEEGLESASEVSRNKTQLSVSCWIKLTSTGVFHGIVTEDGGSDSLRFMVQVQDSDVLRLLMRDTASGGAILADSTNTFSSGTWYHILAVMDTSANKMYAWVNGIEWINASPAMGNFYDAASEYGFQVGRHITDAGGAKWMNGLIDELVIWENALDIAAAVALYNVGSGRFYGGTLEAGSGRLPVGDDGQVIVADAAETFGMKWGRKEAFFFASRAGAFDMAANNTWYDYPWNVAAKAKKNVTHNHLVNPEQITLAEGGTYVISWEVASKHSAQSTACVRLLDDGTELPGSYRSQVVIANVFTGALSGSLIAHIAANSVIELQVGAGAAGMDIDYYDDAGLPDPSVFVSAAISIHKISDDTS